MGSKKSEDSQNCSVNDVRTINANQLSDKAINKRPKDSHIHGINHNGSFRISNKITIAGTINIASKVG